MTSLKRKISGQLHVQSLRAERTRKVVVWWERNGRVWCIHLKNGAIDWCSQIASVSQAEDLLNVA